MKQVCKVCEIEKPILTGYYGNSNVSGYDTTCKDCRKKRNNERKKKRKGNAPDINPHELEFIEACKANGIYATPKLTAIIINSMM